MLKDYEQPYDSLNDLEQSKVAEAGWKAQQE
jgi:hypothetical protein